MLVKSQRQKRHDATYNHPHGKLRHVTLYLYVTSYYIQQWHKDMIIVKSKYLVLTMKDIGWSPR